MSWFYYFVLFVFGLFFGSFLNVCAIRYVPVRGARVFDKKIIGGRSKCVNCLKTLKWFELVPIVSFLALQRKCRTCKEKISLQYPIVEFLTGLLFVLLAFCFSRFYLIGNIFYFRPELISFYIFLLLWLAILWLLLLLSVIDFHHFIIPDELNIILLVLGCAVLGVKFFSSSWLSFFYQSFLKGYAFLFTTFQGFFINHILGFFIAGFFFWFLVVITKGRGMGFGDVKLAFPLGLILGWPDVGFAIVLSLITGGVFSLFLILIGKKTLRDKIPFAPFLALGVFLTVFFGYQIVKWYFGLFSI